MPYVLIVVLCAMAAACSESGNSAPAEGQADAPAGTLSRVTGRAPAGSLISLQPADAELPLPEGHAVLDQFSKAFVPETLFVRVGQPVLFKNSEDQLHNVTVVRTRTGAGVFNISQNQGDTYTHTFDQAGEYDVTCDVHPGMRATIIAATTPHAVYADTRGAFTFENITPGAYRIRVSSSGRDVERRVEIAAGSVDLGDVRPGSGR